MASLKISYAAFMIKTNITRLATESITGKPSLAPAIPTSAPIDENASERWCHASAMRALDFDRGVSDWETANVLTGGGDLILNGVQAVGYSRERQTSGSDFNRTSRQRAVIEQIIVKAKKMSVTQLNDLANSILPKVYTNMSESEILGMVADAVTYLGYDLEQYRVPFDNMYESVNGNLLPDYEATNQKLQDIIFATE